MKKDVMNLINDPKLILGHIILKQAKNEKFIEHWKTLGDKVDIKVIVGGYEVEVDSFQDMFWAMWERNDNKENERVKGLMLDNISKLSNELNTMSNFIECTTNDLIKEIEW